MSAYTFIGLVHPERAVIDDHSLKVKIGFQTKDAEVQYFEVDIRILNNQFLANVDGGDFFDAFTMRNIIRDLAQDELARIAFLSGHSYTLEIIRVVNPTREWDFVYGVNNPLIQDVYPIDDFQGSLGRIKNHCSGELGVYINNALKNMSEALSKPNEVGLHCFRALEWLRNHNSLRLQSENEKDWGVFRDVVGVDENYIRGNVQRLSIDSRHGRPMLISDLEYSECIKSTWLIFYRYLDVLDNK